MEIQNATLASLSVDSRGSYGISASAVDRSEDLYTYLRITDIRDDGTLNTNDMKSVDDKKAEQYLLKPNDIVFARTGASTGRNYFYDGTDGELVYAGFLIKFSIDPEKVNPKYIKYYCLSDAYKGWIHSFNTGSTRGNINARTLGEMPVPIPPRAQQDGTVAILSSLDEKIRKNAEINKNLEQQAQTIFTEEFLFLDGVPEGWSKSSLLGIANYLNGLAMQKFRPSDDEQGLPVLKIKELRQGSCDANSELCSPSIKPEYIVHDGDVIFSWSGSLLVDFWCGGTCGLNQHLFKVTSSEYAKWFYFAWTNHHLQKFAAIAADMATTMGHIKREELAKAEVLIPSQSDYDRIGGILAPLYDLVIANRIENRKLASLRDELLPQLMSGQLDVSEVSL
jgi:type I restriction enzyme S subunit